jgi:HlyD family secretion protein
MYYTTVTPEERDIFETIFIPGNVFPAKEIEIKSQLSGILDEVIVKIGDYVEEGTPVASIKLVPGTFDIERLESNVNTAKIEYNARLTEYERAKRLYDTQTISKIEMDEYTRVYMLSRENLNSAKNHLDILKKGRVSSRKISNLVTTSTSGTVIDIPLEVGASVIERNNYNPGTTIAVVAEMNLFKFRTLIAEHYLQHVSLGDTILLVFNAYRNLMTKAIVNKISSKGNLENGIMKYMLEAEFSITENMPVLRSGYSATAEVVLNSRNEVLSVEEKYIVYRNDSAYLYVLGGSGKEKVMKKIIPGISDGKYTEIIDGASLEDRLITNYDKEE